MPELRATLRLVGHGIAEGELGGHPDPLAIVRTRRITPAAMHVTLWHKGEPGDRILGAGDLIKGTDGWRGTCSEGMATWFLRGEDGAVVFSSQPIDDIPAVDGAA